jgi:hypothetical protein
LTIGDGWPLDQGADVSLTLGLLERTPAQMAALQAVFEATPRYFEVVGGKPPAPRGSAEHVHGAATMTSPSLACMRARR